MTSREKEKPSRLTSNAKDRDKIRDKLLTYIAPLDPYSYPADLGNVITGLIAFKTVYAHVAVNTGK